jgi:hypothetical protein
LSFALKFRFKRKKEKRKQTDRRRGRAAKKQRNKGGAWARGMCLWRNFFAAQSLACASRLTCFVFFVFKGE